MKPIVSTRYLVFRFVLAFIVMAAGLFGPAGTFLWPEAWLFMAVIFGWAFLVFGWLARHNQQLLSDRLTYMKGTAVGWDKVFTVVNTLLFVPMLILPGLDAVRFGWSPRIVALEALGLTLFVVTLLGIFWTMRENTYLSRVVEIQPGQRVINTGPYARVRHPMYACSLVMMPGMALALGSYWSLIPALLASALLIVRTRAEDRLLQRELPGYAEYAQKVRWRLLPGVW